MFDVSSTTLKIDVTGAGLRIREPLRGRLVRRVLLALSRFGPRVRKVTVYLAQPVNPLGGVDRRCRIRVLLQASDELQAEAINGGFEAAVARAVAQLAKRLDGALVVRGAHDRADGRPAATGPRIPDAESDEPRHRPARGPRRGGRIA